MQRVIIATGVLSTLLSMTQPARGEDFPWSAVLGQYPILQFIVAVMTVVVISASALSYLKAGMFKAKEPVRVEGDQVKINADTAMFYSGPLKAIFDLLTNIHAHQLLARLEHKDDVAALMSSSRHTILNKMADVQAEICEVVGDGFRDQEAHTENRVRDLNANVNALHTRLDGMQQSMARIEGSLVKRR